MAEVYSRNQMKVTVAKMLQTIGWNSINSTPLDILTDIMVQYVVQLARSTHDYATEFGCVHPSLDHLGLAFRDFHVNLTDLEEYVTYVNFAPPPSAVPKYPVAKENNLNFLKPGSKEVITRQVHVHEHLPPMYQTLEAPETDAQTPVKSDEVEEVVHDEMLSPVFKRPADVSPSEALKKTRLNEEEGRPTREIISVMMTTSGYISPAREGKMPESRTPTLAVDPVPLRALTPPPPVSVKPPPITTHALDAPNYPPATAFEGPGVAAVPPPPKVKSSKKTDKPEKKKSSKELFKNGVVGPGPGIVAGDEPPVKIKPEKVKKPPREPKPRKPSTPRKLKDVDKSSPNTPTTPKVNKALAAARMKTEKLNTTITPIPKVDKLSNEPDKKKANIFKKISKVKPEVEVKPPKSEIRTPGHSPDLVVDEPLDTKLNIPSDVTIELVNAAPVVEKQEKLFFDDDSPPGTPATPKTPEMMVHATPPPVVKEKRKRKDKTKVKKVVKPSPCSPIDVEMERPKTPEAHVPASMLAPPSFPQFPSFPAFPGVGVPGGLSCPPQLINPLIPMNPLNQFFGMTPPGMPAFMNRPGMPGFMPPMPTKPPPPAPSTHSSPEVKPKSSAIPDSTSSIDVLDSPTSSPRPEITKKKKDKKDKIKKKNKKDKLKNKGEKKKLKEEKSKEKDKIKKEKKEKRKEKEKEKEKEKDKDKDKERENVNLKLTLKIGGEASPRPDTPDRKLIIKPIIKRDEETPTVVTKREMSPELAKISALVTGQPKPKLSPVVPLNIIQPEILHLHVKKSMFKPNPNKLRPKEPKQEPESDETNLKSKYIEEVKEEKAAPSPPVQRANPGPGRPPVVGNPRPTGPGRPSGPGRPRIHPIKQKPLKPNKPKVASKDSEGNEVWICPACGRQDDGSPMIGCDDCDAWYHWVCVGIQVPPDETENWYCRLCIAKKQEVLHTDKKKKRKKKEKKEH